MAANSAAAGARSVRDGDEPQPFSREGHLTGRPLTQDEVSRMQQDHNESPPAPADAGAAQAPGHTGQPQPGPQATSPDGQVAMVPQAELEAAMRERDEYRDDLQRLAAEFDNFRKRSQREISNARRIAADSMLNDLLGVLDDIDRAVAMTPDSAEHEGFMMVRNRFHQVIESSGLAEVNVTGVFDPQLHEAIHMQPGSGKPEGTILEVAQKGYQVDERVVRFAKVVVAGGD